MLVGSEQVVSAARSLIGVPFRHQGRSASKGLDCVGFILEVGRLIGDPIHDTKESRRYNRNPKEQASQLMIRCLQSQMISTPTILPGCVLVAQIGRRQLPKHLMIFAGSTIIHADPHSKKIIEQPITSDIQCAVVAAFRYRATNFEISEVTDGDTISTNC